MYISLTQPRGTRLLLASLDIPSPYTANIRMWIV